MVINYLDDLDAIYKCFVDPAVWTQRGRMGRCENDPIGPVKRHRVMPGIVGRKSMKPIDASKVRESRRGYELAEPAAKHSPALIAEASTSAGVFRTGLAEFAVCPLDDDRPAPCCALL